MVVARLYGSVPAKLANKEIDWDTDTIKVALCTSSYTPSQDTHDYFNDITNEVTGTGYTAGGATLTGKTVNYTAGTNTTAFDAADVTWATSTITARYAIVYVDTAGASTTDPLIAYIDFEADVSSTAGPFALTWDAAGVFTATVA
ncbi:hypothetical protein [Arthrobacter sp. Alg241-R88]|uniref:hypothetical protein n=1 Tax=Arthrobacter sp. Alg241-R88 TaxID=2305984 RepID=UPI0013D4B733|nr:hypothetical protein [Arthrobacter sp. Alg241-R88]